MAQKKMKLPNNYGSVTKLSGNRRRPYRVRITADFEVDMDGTMSRKRTHKIDKF